MAESRMPKIVTMIATMAMRSADVRPPAVGPATGRGIVARMASTLGER